MRKHAVLLVVVLLLILAQAGQGADLQAGWYAKIQGVHVYSYGHEGYPILTTGGYFYSTPPGQYGPFEVTGGDPERDYRRYVNVPTDAVGVGPDQSLALPLYIPLTQGTEIAHLELAWATNYDASSMYVQLWHHTDASPETVVWEQKLSGTQGGGAYLAYDTILNGHYYFKINVVPEPSGAVCLATLACGLLGMLRWRRV